LTGSAFFGTAYGVALRNLRRTLKSPPLWLPSLMFPLLLFAAFAGGLGALGKVPNFGYPNYTTFQFVYVLMQSAAVAGMQTGLSIAGDFESGFAQRMMLSTRSRAPMVLGYVMTALVRAVVVGAILFGVGLIAGMQVSGSPLQILGVVLLALSFNLVITLWAIGFALRARSLKAGVGLQMPVLILMFLVPVYTPRPLLAHWVRSIADYNPITALLEACRGLVVGKPVSVALACGLMAGLAVVFVVWVATGLRSAERTGGLRA
jgi:ABC-type multidrug transport system permease subunit